MARPAEGLKDSGACMAHSKYFITVRWTPERRDLQGLVALTTYCCRQLDQPSPFVNDSTAQHCARGGIRSHSRTVPGLLIRQSFTTFRRHVPQPTAMMSDHDTCAICRRTAAKHMNEFLCAFFFYSDVRSCMTAPFWGPHCHHHHSDSLESEHTFLAGRILGSRTTGQARLALPGGCGL